MSFSTPVSVLKQNIPNKAPSCEHVWHLGRKLVRKLLLDAFAFVGFTEGNGAVPLSIFYPLLSVVDQTEELTRCKGWEQAAGGCSSLVAGGKLRFA